MSKKNMEEETNENFKEKELIQKEEFQTEQSSLKSKKRLIILVSIIILILIVIISIILIFTLNDDNNNETNNDEIEILPPLVQNSTSGNHTHTIIFMPGFGYTPEDFKDFFMKRINFTKKMIQL